MDPKMRYNSPCANFFQQGIIPALGNKNDKITYLSRNKQKKRFLLKKKLNSSIIANNEQLSLNKK